MPLGQGQGGGGSEDLKRSKVCRLRGLPFSAQEADVKGFFSSYELGPNGVIVTLNHQGRSTGMAFVEFATAEVANRALDKNRQHMGNRYIEVFKASTEEMESALRAAGRSVASKGSVSANGTTATPVAPPAPATTTNAAGSNDTNYAVVRMRGLPFSASPSDIVSFFKDLPISQDGIHICIQPDGRPTGEAFVEFVNEETTARALHKHREPMGQRYIELYRVTKGDMLAAKQQQLYGVSQPTYAHYAAAAAQAMPTLLAPYLAQMQTLAGIPVAAVDPSENVVIKLRGLPYNAAEREILEFFKGYDVAGNGAFVVMGAGADGSRPTGEAYVEFSSPDEATRAMERQRQNIGARYIELFRVSKSEMLLAMGGVASYSTPAVPAVAPASTLDPNLLLLMQQQAAMLSLDPQAAAAAAGAYGLGGILGSQTAWGGMGDMGIAAGFYGRAPQPAPAGAPIAPPVSSAAPGGASAGGGSLGGMPAAPAASLGGLSGTESGRERASGRSSTVKMRGLPFKTQPPDILEFFEGYNVVGESIKMGTAADGRPTGEAWVTFSSGDEAQKAIRERNKHNMGSRYIELFPAPNQN